MKVLHVAAEVFPLVKTGGLADVVAALPVAQAEHGADVRLLLPGLPPVLEAVQGARTVVDIGACFGALRVRLLLARMPGSMLPVYVVDAPYLYRRGGSPYQDSLGEEWPDNLQRFALLGWVAAHLAAEDADPQWAPDIVNAHDWHAAMACAFMAEHTPPRRHRCSRCTTWLSRPVPDARLAGARPGLAPDVAGRAGVPRPAQLHEGRPEVRRPRHHRQPDVCARDLDPRIRLRPGRCHPRPRRPRCGHPQRHRCRCLEPGHRSGHRSALRRRAHGRQTGVPHCAAVRTGARPRRQRPPAHPRQPAHVAEGLDLVLAALPELLRHGVQFAVQGTGEPALEAAFRIAQQAHPGRVHVHVGYDEGRAHRLVAGADVIAVPSRFEPCGLTQMYGLRYGTLPVVRRVGGLADTVQDADEASIAAGRATGFVFDAATPAAFERAVLRAVEAKRNAQGWQRTQAIAMARPLAWGGAAAAYLALYEQALQQRCPRS